MATSAIFANTQPAVSNDILGANGLFFDADDNLHVASFADAKLWVLDRNTGETLHVYDKSNGVLSPDDVTIDAQGTIYVTNILQGSVNAIKRDGTFRQVADLGRGANPVTVRDDGSLWVARDFLGEGLYRLDASGAQAPVTIIAKPGWINAMDFGPDGMLYGPLFKPASVIRIDPATGATTTIFTALNSEPYALKFNHRGELYVLEGRPGRVLKIDLQTRAKTIVANYAPGLDNLAFDSQDRLFISSFYDGSIHEVMADGSLRELRGPSPRMARALLHLQLAALAVLIILLGCVALLIKRIRKKRH